MADDELVDRMLAQWYGEDNGDSLQRLEADVAKAAASQQSQQSVKQREEGGGGAEGEEEGEEEEEQEEEEETKALNWVDRIKGQEAALFLFAVPDDFDPVHDDWAMMYAGSYPNVEAAEAVQEDLMGKDDRFTTMVCQMYDGIARFPPAAKEYKGRVRYRSKHMQEVHDSVRSTQEEAKSILKSEAEKRQLYRETDAEGNEIEDLDTEHGQMFPMPTTTITKDGIKQSVVDADIIVDKGVDGAAQHLATVGDAVEAFKVDAH